MAAGQTTDDLLLKNRKSVQRPADERGYFWVFAAIVLVYCAWVLSLPLVPSQDGPVHLYLASIFNELLHHSSGISSHYYYVKHYLPPYSFHYYLLVALMHLIPPLLAEKLFVCLILVSFAFGFRYLATGIGQNGPVFALFSLGLLLNWSLAMGFENYLCSLTMSFWTLGLWARGRSSPAIGLRIGFFLLLGLMTLTHPVPVAIVLGFTGLDLAVGFAARAFPERLRSSTREFFGRDVAALIAGSTGLVYISRFTEKRRTADNIRNTIHPLAEFRSFYGHLEGVRYFNGVDWRVHVYSLTIYLLLVIAAGTVVLRSRKSSPGALSWRIAFFGFLIVMPVVPMDINGSHMFAARLVILVWLAAFAAASGTEKLPRGLELCLVSLAAATSIGIVSFAHAEVSREARQIAEITTTPVTQQGKLGLLLPGVEEHRVPAYDFVVDPFVWEGAQYFRIGRNVLLNTPWTDIPILPVNATPAMGLGDFDPSTIEFYFELRKHIEDGDPTALGLLARSDFVLFGTEGQPVDSTAVDRILHAEPNSRWSCAVTTSWTEVCERLAAITRGV